MHVSDMFGFVLVCTAPHLTIDNRMHVDNDVSNNIDVINGCTYICRVE